MATVVAEQPVDQVKPVRKQEAREYVVLCALDRPGEWWQLPENGWGVNEQAAKEDAIGKLAPDEQTGTFVGVPVRSWKPRARSVETRTRPRWH